jgi:hypothetical protein
MENKKAFGCIPSEYDPRTVKHEDVSEASAFPLVKGGFTVLPSDITDQYTVGICTAISHIQNRQRANHKLYSADFQYLLQKAFYDGNWDEGSSILSSLKVGVKYGYLPAELWTHTTLADRELPYSQYVAKLKAINGAEVNRLIALCVDKIPGYASVALDPQSIATAIIGSQAGVLCRFSCGESWYTGKNGQISWQPKDIDPIQPSILDTDGHAIDNFAFDFTTNLDFRFDNTWGTSWDIEGTCNIFFDEYPASEVWTILLSTPVVNQYPTIKMGATGTVVKTLQTLLNQKNNAGLFVDGLFGSKTKQAVENYQSSVGLVADGVCGPLTWTALLKVV